MLVAAALEARRGSNRHDSAQDYGPEIVHTQQYVGEMEVGVQPWVWHHRVCSLR